MRALGMALLVGTIVGAMLSACSETSDSRIAQGCTVPPGFESVSFVSAKRLLHGVLEIPDGPGPYPVVLLLHDSGQTDVTRGKGDFQDLRAALHRSGVASFVWDQPGSGCSGGRYRGIADLYVRSDDVLAAVEALKAHERIDSTRIGAWALGEGVWAGAMAAARGGLDFLILVGGPSGSPIDRIRYQAERHLESQGFDEADAAETAAMLAEALEMMRDQAPYREYRAEIQRLSGYPLLSPMNPAGGDVHANERRYAELQESAVLHLTADVFLAALDIPVLALWGDEDTEADWRRAVAVYGEAFERAGNRDAAVRVFAGADHSMCEVTSGEQGCRLDEAYLESISTWLRVQGFAGIGERQSRVTDAAPGPVSHEPRP